MNHSARVVTMFVLLSNEICSILEMTAVNEHATDNENNHTARLNGSSLNITTRKS